MATRLESRLKAPTGCQFAFVWTKGYEPGNYNIFVMDIAARVPVQLTHGAGRNENPWWAPDGVHMAVYFLSKRVAALHSFTRCSPTGPM